MVGKPVQVDRTDCVRAMSVYWSGNLTVKVGIVGEARSGGSSLIVHLITRERINQCSSSRVLHSCGACAHALQIVRQIFFDRIVRSIALRRH